MEMTAVDADEVSNFLLRRLRPEGIFFTYHTSRLPHMFTHAEIFALFHPLADF
jgi:hypothetical protein